MVAKALDLGLRRVVAERVSELQHGFVAGRTTGDAIVHIETEMLCRYECELGEFPGAIFLDQAAAFASISHEWLHLALVAIGVPIWLVTGLLALYHGGRARIGWHGGLEATIGLASGIRQGCPTSGSVWALVFDPIIRGMYALLRPRGGSLRVYADDVAAGVRNLFLDLPAIVQFSER